MSSKKDSFDDLDQRVKKLLKDKPSSEKTIVPVVPEVDPLTILDDLPEKDLQPKTYKVFDMTTALYPPGSIYPYQTSIWNQVDAMTSWWNLRELYVPLQGGSVLHLAKSKGAPCTNTEQE